MKLGSLFSGAGLGDLGWMMAGFDIRWQVEIDKYCRKILDLRFPEAKKYDDIKKIKGSEVEPVDIVVGGFPCQPFSVAGKQRGTADDRNLWPEMLRVVKEVRPAWVVGENVSGIIPIYLDTVLADLESAGYAARTFVFPAHALGANHRRERIWIVGHAEHNGRIAAEKRRSVEPRNECGEERTKQISESARPSESSEIMGDSQRCGFDRKPRRRTRQKPSDRYLQLEKNFIADSTNARSEGMCKRKITTSENMADADQQGPQGHGGLRERTGQRVAWPGCEAFKEYWKSDAGICRVAHGAPNRIHRLKALGNGQVVVCTFFIGQQIMEFERMKGTHADQLPPMPQNL